MKSFQFLRTSAVAMGMGFLLSVAAFAQKTKTETNTDTSYKNGQTRTDTYSVVNVQPPTSTVQTSGTNTLIPVKVSTETATGTGTQTSTKDMGANSQVGGIQKDGDGNGKRIQKPEASVRYNIVIPENGGKPTVEMIKVEAPLSCEDAALKEIFKILNTDQNNVFSRMVELTVMRLAKKALAEGNATLEDYTKSKIEDLEKQLNQIKGSKELQDRVKAVYAAYGQKSDLEAIEKDLEQAIKKGKKACFWSVNNQLSNERVSAYVLVMGLADPDPGVGEADAATIWALEKIRTLWNGGLIRNQLDVNYRVARYLGVIKGGVTESEESLDAKIKAEENSLNELIRQAYTKVKEKLYACIDQANPNCAQCALEQKAKFESDRLGLEKIQQQLASEVLRAESRKKMFVLKGKIGSIPFDFAQTLPRGTVETVPERIQWLDACGNRKRPKILNRMPNQAVDP